MNIRDWPSVVADSESPQKDLTHYGHTTCSPWPGNGCLKTDRQSLGQLQMTLLPQKDGETIERADVRKLVSPTMRNEAVGKLAESIKNPGHHLPHAGLWIARSALLTGVLSEIGRFDN